MHRFFQKYEPQSPGICAFLLLIVPAVVSGVFVRGASSVLGPLCRTYAIFYTSLILSVVFYRLSPFHPLAKYPGPALAKVSKLWFVGSFENTRQVLDADYSSIQGAPGLAGEAARSLSEPPQEIWRRGSCRYVKSHLENSNSFEPKHHIRSKRDDAQRRFRDCTTSGTRGLGQGELCVAMEGRVFLLLLTVHI